MTTPTIVRADPAMRRQALLLVLAGTLVSILVIGYGLPWLERWLIEAMRGGNLAARRMVCIGAGLAIALLGLLVTLSGANMIRIGRRVVRGRRFPPEGLRVLRDTRVVAGSLAVLLGRMQAVIGVTILACAAVLVGLGGYIVVRLWP